jgi:hypothetical protein
MANAAANIAPNLGNTVLDRLAGEEAHEWANGLFRLLREQGRFVEGGWPGTISEARHRVALRIASGGWPPAITQVQREQMIRAVYLGAKKHWLARSAPPSAE